MKPFWFKWISGIGSVATFLMYLGYTQSTNQNLQPGGVRLPANNQSPVTDTYLQPEAGSRSSAEVTQTEDLTFQSPAISDDTSTSVAPQPRHQEQKEHAANEFDDYEYEDENEYEDEDDYYEDNYSDYQSQPTWRTRRS